jgi:succinate dehydrogenase / fumarate reductase membrane anchor subunit
MSLRSPLGRVLGSGSAREGTDHWWMQRVSAVALALLGSWFVVSVIGLPDFSQASVRGWIAEPWNALFLSLLGVALAYHSSLGLQVVIEDYVHAPFLKVASLVASKFAHIVIAVAATFAVLKIAFGSA